MKKLMLVDPHIDNEPMWVEFYDKNFDMTNGNQYVCQVTPKQVVDILNSVTLKIVIPEDLKDKLNIKSKPCIVRGIEYLPIYYISEK